MNKLLVITGPTATGKTALGLGLAAKFDGEIISADSRQVYKYMDIGTGKDTGHFQWGIDLVEPDNLYSVSDWVNYTQKVLTKIKKLPIIVGGTGQYIKELLFPSETLHIPPNEELRSKNYELCELQDRLQKINPQRWGRMNESDRKNPRRLIRAIETTGKIASPAQRGRNDTLIIGLTAPLKILYERIDKRVEERLAMGMEEERKKLSGFKLPKTIGYNGETAQEWKFAEHAYARRQLIYLRKYLPETLWLDITQENWRDKAYGIVEEWRQKS